MLAGRTFARREAADVAIINAELASRLWPGESAVGRRIRVFERAPWRSVVGVVGNVEMRVNISNERTPLQIYTPLDIAAAGAQRVPVARARRTFVSRRIMVRARDLAALLPVLKRQVWTLDKTLPVQGVRLLQDVWQQTFAPQLLVLLMMSAFSGVALALAAAGLFAVISHLVARRTHEIGIRVALGATRRDVFRLVMARVMPVS